jgi:hypothetical protein
VNGPTIAGSTLRLACADEMPGWHVVLQNIVINLQQMAVAACGRDGGR